MNLPKFNRPNFGKPKTLEEALEIIGRLSDHVSSMGNKINDGFQTIARDKERAGDITVITSGGISIGGGHGGGGGSARSIEFNAQTVSVVVAGTYVPFTYLFSTDAAFGILGCKDASGNTVGCRITGLTRAGFWAYPKVDAELTYFAIEER
jgi:hypothetical protein